jgi:hypothetical protein
LMPESNEVEESIEKAKQKTRPLPKRSSQSGAKPEKA